MKKTSTYLTVIFSFFIWSLIGPILNKSIFTPFQNIFLISILACFYIILIPNLRSKLNKFKKMDFDKNFVIFFLASGLSGVIWLKSLTLIPIGQAVLLYSSAPFFAFILERFLFNEKIKYTKFIPLFLGLFGVALILSDNLFFEKNNFLIGNLMVIIAALLTAIQGNFNKKISSKYSLTTIVFIIMLAQAVVGAPFAFASPWLINNFSLIGVIFLSIFSSLLAFYLYVGAFRSLKASSVVLLGYVEPLFASIWGFLFLSQLISPIVVLGGIIILLSGYLMVRLE